jgi:ABC-2 type transport system ATP-binding protein
MSPLGFLKFVAEVRGMSAADTRRRIDEVIGRLQLGKVIHQPIDTLSKGFKRRVGLAQAILHDPRALKRCTRSARAPS